jgi:nocturnin
LQEVEIDAFDALRRFDPGCDGWMVCGDFNRRPDGEVVTRFREAGFEFAHSGRLHIRSAVANGKISSINYLFHTEELVASPIDPPPVSDGEVLPSEEQPSDHLALAAEFEWVDEGEER